MVLLLRQNVHQNNMNILGIDYGTKRIGLAWMQTGIDVVLPFGVVESADRKKNVEDVANIIKEEKIDKVIIGLPFGEAGQETPNTKRIREFADMLKEKINVPMDFVGEEFTTREAQQMDGDASLDEKAAMLILQSYKSS